MNSTSLVMMQSLPLNIKVAKSKLRVMEAIDKFGIDGLYVSISGGKDSQVLHEVILKVEEELFGGMKIPRVFCNTGLEYPEVVKIVEQLKEKYGELVIIIKPKMNFVDVIKKYGYPVITKEQSQFIHQYRNAKSEKTKLTRWNGNKWGRGKISEKWKYMVDTDIKISDKCCDVMKKNPFKKYEKESGRVPFIGKLACESSKRLQDYIKQGGCNAFNNKRPKSEPLGFWREQDILEFLEVNNIKIAEVYGDIVKEGGEFKLTKCTRTGCMFCLFGIHLEKGKNRMERLKETHPNIYDYCLRGGQTGDDGYWQPNKGLGMKKVLDTIKVKY